MVWSAGWDETFTLNHSSGALHISFQWWLSASLPWAMRDKGAWFLTTYSSLHVTSQLWLAKSRTELWPLPRSSISFLAVYCTVLHHFYRKPLPLELDLGYVHLPHHLCPKYRSSPQATVVPSTLLLLKVVCAPGAHSVVWHSHLGNAYGHHHPSPPSLLALKCWKQSYFFQHPPSLGLGNPLTSWTFYGFSLQWEVDRVCLWL